MLLRASHTLSTGSPRVTPFGLTPFHSVFRDDVQSHSMMSIIIHPAAQYASVMQLKPDIQKSKIPQNQKPQRPQPASENLKFPTRKPHP